MRSTAWIEFKTVVVVLQGVERPVFSVSGKWLPAATIPPAADDFELLTCEFPVGLSHKIWEVNYFAYFVAVWIASLEQPTLLLGDSELIL